MNDDPESADRAASADSTTTPPSEHVVPQSAAALARDELIPRRARSPRAKPDAPRFAAARKTAAYNDRGSRLDNMNATVVRLEQDLAQAGKAAFEGGQSKASQSQIARRLHQARSELAEFSDGAVASAEN